MTDATLHFKDEIDLKDGSKKTTFQRIDMVLTYADTYRRNKGSGESEKPKSIFDAVKMLKNKTVKMLQKCLKQGTDIEFQKNEELIREREFFEENLRYKGLRLQTIKSEDTCGEHINYLLISAPWTILTRYAELLKLRMPLKVRIFYTIVWLTIS